MGVITRRLSGTVLNYVLAFICHCLWAVRTSARQRLPWLASPKSVLGSRTMSLEVHAYDLTEEMCHRSVRDL
jgi:hypothetical protein